MACNQYSVDLTARQFGICKCGLNKQAHQQQQENTPTKKQDQQRGPEKKESIGGTFKTNDTPPKKTMEENHQDPDRKEDITKSQRRGRALSKRDITLGLAGRYSIMKEKVSECFILCKSLIAQLKMDGDLREIEILFEKVSKKNFDAYFPVYGAMKAGKSTVLDCIFESKILPSRSLPMTTIPIKIGHRGKLTEPQLEIPKVKEWNLYVSVVARQAKPIENNPELELLRQDLNNKKFAEGIILGKEIPENLFLLSDVVRIGLMNGITLENNNLDLNIEMLPTLLLKVPMFEDIFEEQNFYFIDTPGPDECRMSDTLEKINRVVLQESCGAMCVIPYNGVAASHTYEIMGPAVDCCIRDNKKLVVIINQIDSMNKMEEELPGVINSIQQGLFNFKNAEILAISASRLKFARELAKEMQKKIEPSELLKSDAWQNYVKANLLMTDKLQDVWDLANKQTEKDLRVFNYDKFKTAVISIYNDAQHLAMTSLLSDMHKIVQRLREFVLQIDSCVKGEGEQLKKLKDLEVQLGKINEYRTTISGMKTNLTKTLPKIFKEESDNFEKWAAGQNWIIVDRDTQQRIEETSFTNGFALGKWYVDESDHKMLPRVNAAFGKFTDKLRDRVGVVVSEEWEKMNKLRDTISGAIGEEANDLILKFSQPPIPRFQNPDFKFETSQMNIPTHQVNNLVVLKTVEFTEHVLKYYLKKAKEHSQKVEGIFNADLENIFTRFNKASDGFENQVKELTVIQKELENKRQIFETELKTFMEQANTRFNEAATLFEDMRLELGVSF